MLSPSINDSLIYLYCKRVFLNVIVKNKKSTHRNRFLAYTFRNSGRIFFTNTLIAAFTIFILQPTDLSTGCRPARSPSPHCSSFRWWRRRRQRRWWRQRRRWRAERGRRATGLGMTRATVRGRQRCPPPLFTPGFPRPRCCSTSSPPLYRITIAATAWMGSQARSHTRARAIIGGGGDGGSNDQTRPNVTVVYTPAYTTSAAAALATLAAAAATVAGQSRRNLLRRAIVTFSDVTFPSFTTIYYYTILLFLSLFFFFLISILLLFLFPVTILLSTEN